MVNIHQVTLLLVEDEGIIAMATARKLESFGYGVLTAGSGEAALKAIHDQPSISLVLMDIDLGRGMSGPEAAQEILKHKNVPIVFLTSHAELEMVEKVRDITRYGYVLKNSGEFVLRSSIEMAFELFNAHENSSKQMRALQETDAHLARGERVAKIGNWQVKLNTNEFTASQGALDIFGSHTEKLSLDYVRNFVLPEYKEAVKLAYEKLLNDKASYDIEFKIRRATDGSIRDIHSIAELDLESNTIFGVIEDFTDFNKLTESLRESEAFYRLLYNAMDQGLALHEIITDEKGKPIDYIYLDVNDSYTRILNLKREELIGKRIKEVMPKVEQYWIDIFGEVALSGKSHYYENYLESTKRYYATFTYSPKKNHFAVLVRDITEQREKELLLQASESKFRTLIKDMNVGVILHGNKTEILLCNPKALELLGLSEEQLFGRDSYHPEWNIIREDGSVCPGDLQPISEAIRLKQSVHNSIVGVYHPRKMTRVWLSVNCVPQFDKNGEIATVVCTFVDISDQKRAALEVSRLLEEKELILKESLHHSKNDMNTISSLLYLQADTLKDPIAITALNESASRIESMKLLYEKLYRSSSFKNISLKEYLESLTEEILSHFPNTANIRLNREIEDALIDANKVKYVGIIVNELLTNIMKYAFPDNRDGTISVSCKTTGTHLTICVADNGIGLPEDIDFEHSTGFGLQLVYALTQQYNGTIRIEREEGTKIVLELDA
ncbi:hypothetical protein MASR2M78_21980 [Treponema sp.]